jgi:hypothetical protein
MGEDEEQLCRFASNPALPVHLMLDFEGEK